MSNNTVFESDVTCPTVAPETLPEPTVPVEAPSVEKAPKKCGAPRFFALLFAIVAIAYAFLPCKTFKADGDFSALLYGVLLESVSSSNKLFGILPTIAPTGTVCGQFVGLAVYATALCLVLAVLCGIIGLFSKKHASGFLRATLLFVTLSALAFGFSNFLYAYQQDTQLITAITDNVTSWAIAAVGFVASLVYAFATVGKKAWGNLIHAIIGLVAVVSVSLFAVTNQEALKSVFESFGMASFTSKITLAILLVASLGALVAVLRLSATKKNVFAFLFDIVVLLVTAVAVYAAFTAKADLTIALVAVVPAVLNVLVWICSGKKKAEKKEKAKAPVVAEAVEVKAPVDEYVREEYAEALPYEGGPVEGVELAEEVNPTYVTPPAEVQTAGYDFYNCKSFDPFIALLSTEERNQFTELFILKYKGTMPELPDYVVGGDNKAFFRKLFIYLGQYRDRIPDGLLTKIYQFAIKM